MPIKRARMLLRLIEKYPTTSIMVVVVLLVAAFGFLLKKVGDDNVARLNESSAATARALIDQQARTDYGQCLALAGAREDLRETLIDLVLSKPDPANPSELIPLTQEEIDSNEARRSTQRRIGPGGRLSSIVCTPPTTTTT